MAASSFKGGKLPDCRSECPAGSWKPAAKVKPTVHRLLSSQLFNATIVAANEEGASSGTSFPVGQINVLPGAVVASNITSTDGGLLLSVKQTASLVVQSWEAPAELNDFVPMSSAVTLETDRTVEIDAQHMNQGIELDLCLALPPSDSIDAVCDEVLKRLAPFFVAGLMWDDQAGALIDASINTTKHGAVANKLQQMAGGCTRGSVVDCSCSCLFVTKHLTSFIVADVGQELQGEETAEFESSKRFNAQVKAEVEASSGQTYDNGELAGIDDSAGGIPSRASSLSLDGARFLRKKIVPEHALDRNFNFRSILAASNQKRSDMALVYTQGRLNALASAWLPRHAQNYVSTNGTAQVTEALLALPVSWESAFVDYAVDGSFPTFMVTQDPVPYHCVKQVDAPSCAAGHKFKGMIGVGKKYRGAEKTNAKGEVVGAPWGTALIKSPAYEHADQAARWVDRLFRNQDWIPFLNEMASEKFNSAHKLYPHGPKAVNFPLEVGEWEHPEVTLHATNSRLGIWFCQAPIRAYEDEHMTHSGEFFLIYTVHRRRCIKKSFEDDYVHPAVFFAHCVRARNSRCRWCLKQLRELRNCGPQSKMLDRRDSSGGYTFANTCYICDVCQKAKGTLTVST
jgi:hypothetical protein